MIRGNVSLVGVPTITITVAGKDWPAIIDTGFNGDLELPEVLRKEFTTRYVGRATASLAGGQAVEEDIFLSDFPFDGRTIQAEVKFVTGSQILIGTHLLREYALQVDFVNKTVCLDRA